MFHRASVAFFIIGFTLACENAGGDAGQFTYGPDPGELPPAGGGGGGSGVGGGGGGGGGNVDGGVGGGGWVDDAGSAVCGPGGITGRVCAPSARLFLAQARVFVDATDCNGNAVHRETTSDNDGRFTLSGVPSGRWTLTIEKGSFRVSRTVQVIAGRTVNAAESEEKLCFARNAVKIAVVTGDWDNVGHSLDTLGFQYDTIEGRQLGFSTDVVTFLRDRNRMMTYDIIMLNCGSRTAQDMPSDWPTAAANLKAFVEAGKSLYVSDWAHMALESLYPGAVEFYGQDDDWMDVDIGSVPQTVNASIVSSALSTQLGRSTVSVTFPSPRAALWAVMERTGTGSEVLIRGSVQRCQSSLYCGTPITVNNAPLTVLYRTPGNGKILYTSFHWESVASNEVLELLRAVLFML
ncbi:MAG: carboxypeptidase regulatory-like domain-containing protein [Deltaproteobacteria bacterium]|nr:carboxypeptidase regulatory-like domain-containing protein [Deltaproteobacteria bacterium]